MYRASFYYINQFYRNNNKNIKIVINKALILKTPTLDGDKLLKSIFPLHKISNNSTTCCENNRILITAHKVLGSLN